MCAADEGIKIVRRTALEKQKPIGCGHSVCGEVSDRLKECGTERHGLFAVAHNALRRLESALHVIIRYSENLSSLSENTEFNRVRVVNVCGDPRPFPYRHKHARFKAILKDREEPEVVEHELMIFA